MFRCSECPSAAFSYRALLLRHLRAVHAGDPDARACLCCPYCPAGRQGLYANRTELLRDGVDFVWVVIW